MSVVGESKDESPKFYISVSYENQTWGQSMFIIRLYTQNKDVGDSPDKLQRVFQYNMKKKILSTTVVTDPNNVRWQEQQFESMEASIRDERMIMTCDGVETAYELYDTVREHTRVHEVVTYFTDLYDTRKVRRTFTISEMADKLKELNNDTRISYR